MKLNKVQSSIIVAIIAVIISIITIFIINKTTGWKSFTMNRGENFNVLDNDPKLIEKLRFKDCVVTYKSSNNETKKQDVTSVLNRMALAYEESNNIGNKFKLDDPGLSVYSFQVKGFNDSTSRPDSSWDDDAPNAAVTMTGYYKLLK